MKKLIACCGLNCAACDARIATIANDDELRAQTAEKWKVQYGASDITPDMINCTGCREPGAKIGHCDECKIRNCVKSNDFQTCADCEKLENCSLLIDLHKFVPEALENLKSLN
jgi:predicted nucleic acid binding AN1-type Zn finger protein